MSFKLFYNIAPTKNTISNAEPNELSFIWNDNDNFGISLGRTDIHDMFDVLGMDYEWSESEKDSLVFVNVGSISHQSERFEQVVKETSEKYKKAIIYTSQEPWQLNYIEKILDKYENIILMDNSVPVEGKQLLDRYKPFPFMILRMLSIPSNIMMVYPQLNYNRIKQKFNCLLWNWRIEKHICLSYLKKKKIDINNVITYKKYNEDLIAQDNVIKRIEEFFKGWGSEHDEDKKQMMNYSKKLISSLEDLNLVDDIKLEPIFPSINSSFRALPRCVYESTAFSLVCESFSGSSWDFDENQQAYFKDSQAFITEKTLFPLMNGHPWLTFGEHDFHKAMESYGFRVHDELFDMSFDSETNTLNRIEQITNIVKDTDLEFLSKSLIYNKSETHKKILHNKYQMFNKNSFLWKKLKLQFTKYMDEILEL